MNISCQFEAVLCSVSFLHNSCRQDTLKQNEIGILPQELLQTALQVYLTLNQWQRLIITILIKCHTKLLITLLRIYLQPTCLNRKPWFVWTLNFAQLLQKKGAKGPLCTELRIYTSCTQQYPFCFLLVISTCHTSIRAVTLYLVPMWALQLFPIQRSNNKHLQTETTLAGREGAWTGLMLTANAKHIFNNTLWQPEMLLPLSYWLHSHSCAIEVWVFFVLTRLSFFCDFLYALLLLKDSLQQVFLIVSSVQLYYEVGSIIISCVGSWLCFHFVIYPGNQTADPGTMTHHHDNTPFWLLQQKNWFSLSKTRKNINTEKGISDSIRSK